MVVPMTAISNKKQPFNHSQTPTGSGFKGDTDTLRPLTASQEPPAECVSWLICVRATESNMTTVRVPDLSPSSPCTKQ